MDYLQTYNRIIETAKNRTQDVDTYYEKHHIIPKCLGGDDSRENLVLLTGREHFVCHLLLVKIHRGNAKLVNAANMMYVNSSKNRRRGSFNRNYYWLKKLHSSTQSANQSGNKNSQFGTRWIHNVELQQSKKIPKTDELPKGWAEGRRLKFNSYKACKHCGKSFYALSDNRGIHCSKDCRQAGGDKRSRQTLLTGREEELVTEYLKAGTIYGALKAMNLHPRNQFSTAAKVLSLQGVPISG